MRGRRSTFCTLRGSKPEAVLEVIFSWQVQCLVNLDDALKGSKVSFCETVVIVDFGHNDMIPLWQVQHFGCPGFIFRGRRSTLQTSTKEWSSAMFCENLTCARATLS